ncbi:MAG: hypothetical protein IJT73_01720 [Selenomonadaceae bacterium]|nr:hypothetical protein [Selenomonadaceae bacterium]
METRRQRRGYTLHGDDEIFFYNAGGNRAEISEIEANGVYSYKPGTTSRLYIDGKILKYRTGNQTEKSSVEFSGLAKIDRLNFIGSTLYLYPENFDDNCVSVVSNSGNYNFRIDSGDYSGKTFTGTGINDTIENGGSHILPKKQIGSSMKATRASFLKLWRGEISLEDFSESNVIQFVNNYSNAVDITNIVQNDGGSVILIGNT